jgi:hypothetical protein
MLEVWKERYMPECFEIEQTVDNFADYTLRNAGVAYR